MKWLTKLFESNAYTKNIFRVSGALVQSTARQPMHTGTLRRCVRGDIATKMVDVLLTVLVVTFAFICNFRVSGTRTNILSRLLVVVLGQDGTKHLEENP